MSQMLSRIGISPVKSPALGADARRVTMPELAPDEFHRLPGLFRHWDLQQLLRGGDDYHVEYASLTEDGTPLFSVYRRARGASQ